MSSIKRKVRLLTAILLMQIVAISQYSHFTLAGKVEFEKSVNMFAMLKRGYDPNTDAIHAKIYEEYKKSQPQFLKQKSTLLFSQTETLFVPEINDARDRWADDYPLSKQFNTVYCNFRDKSSITEKDIFGNLLLVKDTLHRIDWKITDETREIAGFSCRRANGIVLDSIYVVAFYSVSIPVEGGPESFSGLPGMILGLAIPHENVTWFATKVTETDIPHLERPHNGNIVNKRQLLEAIRVVGQSKHSYGLSLLAVFML